VPALSRSLAVCEIGDGVYTDASCEDIESCEHDPNTILPSLE
jgi:hypothetical protein